MKKIVGFFILMVFFSCDEVEETVPGNILSKEKMVSVMVDVQLVEATLTVEKMTGNNAKEKSTGYFDSILKSHNLSKEEFDRSLKYYSGHPALFEEIYEKVLDELSKMQAEVENVKTNESK